MNKIEVTIMGHNYLLGCPVGGEAALHQAVAKVDREMNAIRDAGKLKARERIAVLAALNLVFYQVMTPATTTNAKNALLTLQSNDAFTIDKLIQRLDSALQSDGHLF